MSDIPGDIWRAPMLFAVAGGSVAAAISRTVARLAFAMTPAALASPPVRAPPRERS